MKIAVATDDGTTVSQHFGRALSYTVITVKDGQIANKETRDKTGHHTFAAQQNASTHLRPFQILGSLLNAHPPGHLAHRRQQGQPAAVVRQRFVGNAGGPAGEHRVFLALEIRHLD